MKEEVSNIKESMQEDLGIGEELWSIEQEVEFESRDLIEESFGKGLVGKESKKEKYLGDIQGQAYRKKESPWRSIIHIDSRIVEVNKKEVHLDCLVDPEKKVVEERVFDRGLFEGHIPIETGQMAILILMERPGEQRIVVKNGKEVVDEEPFELEEDMGDIEETVFSEPSPID